MGSPIPSFSFKDVKPVSYLQKKLMHGIKKTSHFNWFFSKEHNKIALFRSFKYGAIFSTEIERKLELDRAHFMVPMKELAEDHKELKESTNDNEDLSDYYVFATFMPPGDSKVIVSSEDIQDESSYYCCESIVPIRTEEILLHQKRTKKKFEVRQFEKHKSVFRDWYEDNHESLKNAFALDISKTRLRKYTIRQRLYEEVCEILLVNYQRLKEIFNHCIGISSYPNMSWLEFTRLCSHWKLPDRNN